MSKHVHVTATQNADCQSDSQREARLVEAMEEYCHAAEQGQPIAARQLLDRYADIATELAECLAGVQFIQGAAGQLHDGPGHDGNEADRRADSIALNEPKLLGDYRIIREIGRGGMGIVYEAEQLSMNRPVALKILPFAALVDPRQLQRFKNEARAAGSLHHSHIVPVFSVGTERGVHYYAMQYIDGPSLADVLQDLQEAHQDHGQLASAEPLARAGTRGQDQRPGPGRGQLAGGPKSRGCHVHGSCRGVAGRSTARHPTAEKAA